MFQSSDAERKAAIAAQITAEVTATPISRARMNLLWIGEKGLSDFRTIAEKRYAVELVGEGEFSMRFGRVADDIEAGRTTVMDIEWAIGVDRIAGLAEDYRDQDDMLGAIQEFHKALRMAPGCDVYLMSMATLYANLGMMPEALRYIRRATEISPTDERIARNFAELTLAAR